MCNSDISTFPRIGEYFWQDGLIRLANKYLMQIQARNGETECKTMLVGRYRRFVAFFSCASYMEFTKYEVYSRL